MRKIDRVLREIIHRFYKTGERFFSQKGLSETCGLSLGTINPLIDRLEGFGAIYRRPLGFHLIDPKRALTYWSVTRGLVNDVTYDTFVPIPLNELEAGLPRGAVLTAYSGFRAKLSSTPAEYSQVFIYADVGKIRRMFKSTMGKRRNLFVLEPDEHLQSLSKGGVAPLVQIYVDLWQLGTPAKRFVDDLDKRLATTPTKALEDIARGVKRT